MGVISENNKRIVKNTLLLYVRMIFTMVVSLYTSRIVLATLGIDDYGIYNVVGGVVAMFSVLSGSLSSAISRFITFELGHGDSKRMKLIFSTSIIIQIVMAFVVLLVAEIAGVWFINEKMNIPNDRLFAANWVLQCSILTFIINLISVPYNATIIAHEKMSAFAYVSILEVILKLLIVYLLYMSSYDRLIVYALLLMLVALVIRVVYGIYCKKHFAEASYSLIWDRNVFNEMLRFAGWNFLGNTSYILNTQGVNMLINLYFGVALNAARGIAVQVDGAVMSFVNNFTVALNPQITKSYASGDYQYMYKLINQGTKFSFFIMYFFIVPFVLETETILIIWLKEVPEQSAIFPRLVLFASLVSVSGNELYYGIISTGKIKNYQLMVSLVGVMVFPLTWIAYQLGARASSAYLFFIVIYLSLNIIRLNFLKKLIYFPVKEFLCEVVKPISIVAVSAFVLPGGVVYLMPPSLPRLFFVFIISFISTGSIIYRWGLTGSERYFIVIKSRELVKKIANR